MTIENQAVQESSLLLERRGRKIQDSKIPKPQLIPKSPSISYALKEYLGEHVDFRDRTKFDYERHWSYLSRWAQAEGIPLLSMSDFSEEVVGEYTHYMLEQFAPTTVNIRLNTLRAFLNWAYEKQYVSEPLHLKIKKVTVDENDVRFFTEEQVRSLLEVPDKRYYPGYRNYCMMLVMLDNGIRSKELLSVRWEDIDFLHGEIRLNGKQTKNRKFRRVPLCQKTVAALKRLKDESKRLFSNPEYAFVSIRGKQLDASTIRHYFQEYGELAGIDGPCSPHMFRHTFARMYILRGAGMVDLQEVLGHSTLEMSRKYVHIFSQDIVNNHAKYSPVDLILR